MRRNGRLVSNAQRDQLRRQRRTLKEFARLWRKFENLQREKTELEAKIAACPPDDLLSNRPELEAQFYTVLARCEKLTDQINEARRRMEGTP